MKKTKFPTEKMMYPDHPVTICYNLIADFTCLLMQSSVYCSVTQKEKRI